MKSIVEKIPLEFDVLKLKEHLEKFVLPLAPANQSSNFRGWSVQSSTGSYLDGWHRGADSYQGEHKEDRNVFDPEKAARLNFKLDTEFVVPTEICHGYLLEVLERLQRLGLQPCRTRIICLRAQSATKSHRDHRDGFYWIRLHLPIITNPNCAFEGNGESVHMDADGSVYLANVACMHRAVNFGDQDRFHIVSQVWDTKQISKSFPHAGPIRFI